MTVKFGKPSRRKDGQIGARAEVHTVIGGWVGIHAFDTHGLTSAQVAEKIAAFEAKHAKKAKRLTGFRALLGTEFVVAGEVYRLVDCTIRGDRDELYLDVRRVSSTGEEIRERVRGFPIVQRYGSIDGIPNDGQIRQMVKAALPDDSGLTAAHEEFVGKVNAKLAGRG